VSADVTERSGGFAVVQALRDSGTDLVFGIPGTHNLEIYRHLIDSGIRHIAPRHEQGGGYAADGYARASGRPGVLVTTSGPGLTNACTAAATAYADSVPVLIVSPGVPRGLERADVGWLHEMKDQQAHLDCLVERSIRVTSPQHAYQAITGTFAGWPARRPRPVHVEIPVDVLEEAFDPATLATIRVAPYAVRQPSADALDRAAAALTGAGSVLVIAGGGSRRAAEPLRELAEWLDALVLTTVNGKGVLPERHPLSLGASLRLSEACRIVEDVDVLLVVGSELGDSDLWGTHVAPSGTVVRVDIDDRQLQKNLGADVALHGDAETVLREVFQRVARGPRRSGLGRQAAALRNRVDAAARVEGGPWRAVHEALVDALPEDTIVAGDSAQVSYFGTVHQWPMSSVGQFLYPTGFATLGYGLPAAIGAKLGCPDRPVIVLAGDGGTMFTVQEFMTAVDQALPIPVIIMNNGGYGEIRDEMRNRGIVEQAVAVRSPDFPALARALGGRGERVADAHHLATAAAAALAADGPTLLELPVAG
jgi:thiamine pyrophosphate-dependent acetolactate synthase large subunit-like protein